ncbi:hypothetical protein CDO47_35700 [Pseudomonas aeruginosa]|uniref:integrase repeat-containing protein n=1 Tax=Pseudomonas aeruginosa TaxID=287 RepID=UPI000B407D87|nr:hypothetical protein CDO47_35700 [Pseudomonas aeruginosa]
MAAQALGIKNQSDYNKRYRKDPRLPATPHTVYAVAVLHVWHGLLGNERPDLYPTYAEAQAAAQALGIKNQSDYNKRYREDPRLPATPNSLCRRRLDRLVRLPRQCTARSLPVSYTHLSLPTRAGV